MARNPSVCLPRITSSGGVSFSRRGLYESQPGWKLPHEKPQLKLDVSKAWLCLARMDADPSSCEDPARRQLYDTEAEKNFHEASKYILPFAGSLMN